MTPLLKVKGKRSHSKPIVDALVKGEYYNQSWSNDT